MGRRKIALVFLLLFFMVLLLSPWASAPMPSSPASVDDPEEMQTQAPLPELSDPMDPPLAPVDLRVAAALAPSEFEALLQQSEKQAYKFRDIRVSFVRIDPAAAYSAYVNASRVGEAADVMLMDNEWVKSFAVSGFLSPADSAYTGDALSEQLDALTSSLKWNGYLWGVPRDYDPYVLVWNLDALRAITGDSETPPPSELTQWQDLAVKNRSLESPSHWLALSGSDPFAFLYWVQAVTGEPLNAFPNEDDDNPWRETPAEQALLLLDLERAGVTFGADLSEVAASITSGDTAAAIIPYSTARRMTDKLSIGSAGLTMDLSAWKQSYVWPRGRSFTISSRTKAEDAAHRWIAAISETAVQQDNLLNTGKLPVYQSLYREVDDHDLNSIIPTADSAAFPRLPLPDFGPELPSRIANLRSLWLDFTTGNANEQSWVERWRALSSEAKLHD